MRLPEVEHEASEFVRLVNNVEGMLEALERN
jgi:hypothetical protein